MKKYLRNKIGIKDNICFLLNGGFDNNTNTDLENY